MLNFEAPNSSSESGLCLSAILFTPSMLTFGEGNDIPLQYSCLENSMDRGVCWATVHGVARVGHNLATQPMLIHGLILFLLYKMGFPGDSVVKNPPANAGDIRDAGSFSRSESSPEGENGNPLQYSCWKIPWTEEPGGLQPMGSQSQTQLSTYTCFIVMQIFLFA